MSNINLLHFRENPDNLSIKDLAYILKGIFLSFKRSYEIFFKDVSCFIEIYLHGRRGRISSHSSEKEKKNISELLPLNSSFNISYSLFTQGNTQLEQLLMKKQCFGAENKLLNKLAGLKSKGIRSQRSQLDMDLMNPLNPLEKSAGNYLKSNMKSIQSANLEDRQADLELDFQFSNSKEIFSNFIDFNFPNENQEEGIKKIFEELATLKREEKENQNFGVNFPKLFDLNKEFNLVNKIVKNRKQIPNFPFDVENSEESKFNDTLTYIKSKANIKKLRKGKFEKNYCKILLDYEKEKFEKELNMNQHYPELFFIAEFPFSYKLCEEEGEGAKKNNTNSIKYESIQQFRGGKELNESSNKRSLDSSALFSNLSLQEVFEGSGNKKILNRTNFNLFDNEEFKNNMIIEEDSNFNLNTLQINTFKPPFYGNKDLEFHNPYFENEDIIFNSTEKEKRLIDSIGEEVYSFIKKKIDTRSKGKKEILLTSLFIKLKENLQFSNQFTKELQLESITFYQLLLQSQTNNLNLTQEECFGKIFISV
jgi:hypothetical protein